LRSVDPNAAESEAQFSNVQEAARTLNRGRRLWRAAGIAVIVFKPPCRRSGARDCNADTPTGLPSSSGSRAGHVGDGDREVAGERCNAPSAIAQATSRHTAPLCVPKT